MSQPSEQQFKAYAGADQIGLLGKLLEAEPWLVDTTTAAGNARVSSLIESCTPSAFRMALVAGADITQRNPQNKQPLLHTIINNREVEMLTSAYARHGADPEQHRQKLNALRDDKGVPTLAQALTTYEEDFDPKVHEIIEFLLKQGADVEMSAPGYVPNLHRLCRTTRGDAYGCFNTFVGHCRESLNTPSYVDGKKGITPLMLALQHRSFDNVKALIEHGANTKALNSDGQDAFTLTLPEGADLQRNLISNQYRLREYVDEQERDLRVLTTRFTPGIAEIKLMSDGAARRNLIIYAALDILAPLFSPEVWKSVGAHHGVLFAEQLKDSLPPHLTCLRNNIDATALARDDSTPREDSVLVQYARGTSNERGPA